MIIEEANKIFSEKNGDTLFRVVDSPKTQAALGLLSPTGDTLFRVIDTYCKTLRGGEHTTIYFSELKRFRNLTLQGKPKASEYFIALLSEGKLVGTIPPVSPKSHPNITMVDVLNMLILKVGKDETQKKFEEIQKKYEEMQESTFKESTDDKDKDKLIEETVDDFVKFQISEQKRVDLEKKKVEQGIDDMLVIYLRN